MFGLLDLMKVGHLGGIRFSHFDCIGLVQLEASHWQTTMTLRTVFGMESNTELCTICCAETKSLSDPLFALFDPALVELVSTIVTGYWPCARCQRSNPDTNTQVCYAQH
jgi:hypothetical protein